ncbi:hypothetical protein EDC96DRAFT_612886 [Choanephora cucurbitarum]|nr:hypothetical protein EDC96DRAFT_612886 [Choanephora cucurbitarum]
MPILLNYKNVEKRSPTLSAKAEDIPLGNQRHHSPAFNTVHIIAAIIGIAGAVAAAITIFLLCKRKRSKTLAHSNKSGTKHEYSSNSSNSDDAFGSQTNSSIRIQIRRQIIIDLISLPMISMETTEVLVKTLFL